MAPLQLYLPPTALPELRVRGQNDTAGNSATGQVSSGTIFSPGLTAVAIIGGMLVVAFALCFLWMIGVFVDPKKREERDCLPDRRTLDSISKPCSRQVWLSKLRGDNLSAAHYVINQDSCPICLEPVKDSDDIRPLPCSHVFHQNCFDAWFWQAEQPNRCPLCRTEFLDWPKFPKKPEPLHLMATQF